MAPRAYTLKRAGILLLQLLVTAAGLWYVFYDPQKRAQIARHLRFNNFGDPAKIPRDTPYSSLIESDEPILVQHTRLDSRRAEVSLLSTIAYAETASR